MLVWAKRLDVDDDAFEIEVPEDCNIGKLKKLIKKEMEENDVQVNVRKIYSAADRTGHLDPGRLVSHTTSTGLGMLSTEPYYFQAVAASGSKGAAYDVEEQETKKRRLEEVEFVMAWMKDAVLEGDTLTFPPECTLPPEYGKLKSGHNTLFVREICWHLLWVFKYVTKELGEEGILVVGPPGCGKTWTSQFFLWYYVAVDPHDVVFESVSTRTVWVFRKNGTVSSADHPVNPNKVPELNYRTTVYIFDSTAGSQYEMCECAAMKAMWSSANSANYKQTQRHLSTLVFITPNKLELERACEIFGRGPGTHKPVDVEWYFNHSGGALRPPFCMNAVQTEAALEQSSSLVKVDNILSIVKGTVDPGTVHGTRAPTSLFTTVVAVDQLEALPEAEDDCDYRMCEPTEPEKLQALMKAYMSNTVEWRICSEFVFDLLKKNSGDQIEDWNRRFLEVAGNNPILGVTRGNSFQIYVPRVLAGGGELLCRPLEPNALDCTVQFPQRILQKFDTTEVALVLSTCTDPGVLYNISGNLAAFDHYAPPNTFIQTTSVQKPPHVIDFAAAAEICAHCDSQGLRANFFFAVPNDTYKLWKRPQSFAIKDQHTKKRQRMLSKLSETDQDKVRALQQWVIAVDLTSWLTK